MAFRQLTNRAPAERLPGRWSCTWTPLGVRRAGRGVEVEVLVLMVVLMMMSRGVMPPQSILLSPAVTHPGPAHVRREGGLIRDEPPPPPPPSLQGPRYRG